MNLISKMWKIHKNKKLYFKYVMEHKNNILKAYDEMLKCKDLEWIMQDPLIQVRLLIRAHNHDDSKLSKEEFNAYRKHYFPIDIEEFNANAADYQKAWDHHKTHNDHHWQARINWKDEDFNINTELACLENIMDWLAVGYKFNDRPYEYYEQNKDKIILPKKQREFIEKCIYQGIDKQYILLKEDNCDITNML